jgi:uncharacterized membrane protein YhdT
MSTTTCAKCGDIVRLDRGVCPACCASRRAATPDPSSSAASARKFIPGEEDARIQINSRVMWGEDLRAIRADFVRQGVRPGEGDTVLRRAVQGRRDHYRSLGRRNILTGTLLTAGGIVMVIIMAAVRSGAAPGVPRVPIWFIIAPVMLPVSGILLVFKGLRRLRRPGHGETTAHGGLDKSD